MITSLVTFPCFAALALFTLGLPQIQVNAAVVLRDDANGSEATDADVQAYLDSHNTIRSQHDAVPLTWNNTAAEKAQQWANNCTFEHSGGILGALGENLAAGTGNFTIQAAVKDWTDEVSEYDSKNPTASHFTQVVWKDTTAIGCAVQTCDGIIKGFATGQYYVCEYFPQGNVEAPGSGLLAYFLTRISEDEIWTTISQYMVSGKKPRDRESSNGKECKVLRQRCKKKKFWELVAVGRLELLLDAAVDEKADGVAELQSLLALAAEIEWV
ncbi:CAP domain-containing protein [Mycena vitilis]|nr:CAP domain-containing protein [Mycena vitilis]